MFRGTSKRDRLLAIEERRFVVLLGILTIFVAYRGEFPRDFPYPLPYPIPHLQIFVLPVFDRFVWAFGVYAVLMFTYFSEDKLPRWFRELLRRGAWATLLGYWGYFFYISSGLLGSLLVPDWLILPYLEAFVLGLFLIQIMIWEYIVEGKRWIRQAASVFLPSFLKIWSKMRSVTNSLKRAWTWLFAYRHQRLQYLTGALFIINSVLIPVFIGLSWEATQTLDNLQVSCAPYFFSDPVKENRTLPFQFNQFDASILFGNPTLLSLHLFWSLQLNFNLSLPDSGYLSADIGPGEHWAKMHFGFQEPFQQNLALISISFLEIESVSSLFVQDKCHLTTLPYTDTTLPTKISIGNFTANRLDNLLYYAFIQNHNLSNWRGYPACSTLSGSG